MSKHLSLTIAIITLLTAAGCCCSAESIPVKNWTDGNWKIYSKAKFEITPNSVILKGPGFISLRPEYPSAGNDPAKICNGFSFRVRGDGSDDWGCIGIADGGRHRGCWYFPLQNKDWVKYTVAFADMAPNHDNTFRLPATMPVREVVVYTIGDRWSIKNSNERRSAISYEVTDPKLETNAQAVYQRDKYRPMPLQDAVAKMKSGKPVTVSCFGDSITAGTGLKNRTVSRYAALLGPALAKFYKNDQIKSVCAATGGARTFDSIAWLERDLHQGGIPDVATMLIGYNNCSNGQTAEFFREQLIEWIQRITFRTQGKCAILLIPTIPGVPRFHTQEYMAAETRKIAEEYGCTIVPLDTIIKEMGPQEYKKFLADGVHPNESGHVFFTDVLFEIITGKKR